MDMVLGRDAIVKLPPITVDLQKRELRLENATNNEAAIRIQAVISASSPLFVLKKCSIPPLHAKKVIARMTETISNVMQSEIYVEPDAHFAAEHGVILPHTVINRTGKFCEVVIANPTNAFVTLHAKTTLGIATPMEYLERREKILYAQEHERTSSNDSPVGKKFSSKCDLVGNLPKTVDGRQFLQQFKLGDGNLIPEQVSLLEKLLWKHHRVFELHDYDVGTNKDKVQGEYRRCQTNQTTTLWNAFSTAT